MGFAQGFYAEDTEKKLMHLLRPVRASARASRYAETASFQETVGLLSTLGIFQSRGNVGIA